MSAKEFPAALSQREGELREYENLTGKIVEEYWKIVTLKKMLPESLRTMLQKM